MLAYHIPRWLCLLCNIVVELCYYSNTLVINHSLIVFFHVLIVAVITRVIYAHILYHPVIAICFIGVHSLLWHNLLSDRQCTKWFQYKIICLTRFELRLMLSHSKTLTNLTIIYISIYKYMVLYISWTLSVDNIDNLWIRPCINTFYVFTLRFFVLDIFTAIFHVFSLNVYYNSSMFYRGTPTGRDGHGSRTLLDPPLFLWSGS